MREVRWPLGFRQSSCPFLAETYTGSYSYSNTGVNTGDVVLNYDDGDRCTIHVVFTSTTAGTANSTCTDGESLQPNWRLTQIPAASHRSRHKLRVSPSACRGPRRVTSPRVPSMTITSAPSATSLQANPSP